MIRWGSFNWSWWDAIGQSDLRKVSSLYYAMKGVYREVVWNNNMLVNFKMCQGLKKTICAWNGSFQVTHDNELYMCVVDFLWTTADILTLWVYYCVKISAQNRNWIEYKYLLLPHSGGNSGVPAVTWTSNRTIYINTQVEYKSICPIHASIHLSGGDNYSFLSDFLHLQAHIHPNTVLSNNTWENL